MKECIGRAHGPHLLHKRNRKLWARFCLTSLLCECVTGPSVYYTLENVATFSTLNKRIFMVKKLLSAKLSSSTSVSWQNSALPTLWQTCYFNVLSAEERKCKLLLRFYQKRKDKSVQWWVCCKAKLITHSWIVICLWCLSNAVFALHGMLSLNHPLKYNHFIGVFGNWVISITSK